MFGIIGEVAPVLGTQPNSDIMYYSESAEHSENYIADELFEEIVFESDFDSLLDLDDISTEIVAPVIYEWICPTLPMFGYDPEIDPVIPFGITMLSNQVIAIFNGNGNTGGQAPADIIINTPGVLTFPQRGNLVRTGYTFGGWRHAIPGGILYAPGATYSFSAERMGTFTLNAEWIPSQDLTQTLDIDPSGDWLNVANAGSIREVTVTTNQPSWNVSSNQDWIGFSSTSGMSWQSVRIYVQQNTMPVERMAIVTFSAGNAPIRQILVTQLSGSGIIGPAPGDVLLTFNHNNGTNETTLRAGTAGTNIGTLPPAPSRQGFLFAGWWTSPTGGTQINASTAFPNSNTQYWARWTALPNRTVTFDPTGGDLPLSERTRTVQQGLAVGSLPAPTRSGYTFDGWFTARTGGTRVTAATIVLSDVTYFARWNARPYVTVTFNPNGGTISTTDASRLVRQGSAVGPLPTLSPRVGVTFSGWYTALSGGQRVVPGRIINASTTFHARWRVTVLFDSNGGSGVSPRDLDAGARIGTLPTPTRSGHRFVGWFTDVTASTRITEDTVIASHSELVAVWFRDSTELTAIIRFDDTARDHNTVAQMSAAYNNATAMFRNIFGIRMNHTIARDPDLTPILRAGCTHGVICQFPRIELDEHDFPVMRVRCGANCYPNHCKSGSRRLSVNPTETEYTIRIVGYLICFVDVNHPTTPGVHRSVGGLANVGLRNSIASSEYARDAGERHSTLDATQILEWIIQHEIAHNLGARDHSCSEGEDVRCTMRDRTHLGRLCDNCTGAIWQHLLERYG